MDLTQGRCMSVPSVAEDTVPYLKWLQQRQVGQGQAVPCTVRTCQPVHIFTQLYSLEIFLSIVIIISPALEIGGLYC